MGRRDILISILLLFFFAMGSVYEWKKFEQKKIEEKFCLEAQDFSQDQLYQRAMASYFQSYKDDIIFKKSKNKIDDNEKSHNATYNLFVLKKSIRNFYDLQHSLKEQIENPYNTLNSRISGKKIEDKILDGDFVLKGISYGSVVVLSGYSKIRDNIDITNKNFYQQINNKNSFLFSSSASGDANQQNFYPSNCCKIISYADVLKVEKTQENYLPNTKKAKYYLLVSYYSYEINMLIRNMKYLPLKEIYIESQAHPIDKCGRVNFNIYLPMGRLSIN